MADTKKQTKTSAERINRRNEADVKGLFSMYNFPKTSNAGGKSTKTQKKGK